jgi:hypothetical protein
VKQTIISSHLSPVQYPRLPGSARRLICNGARGFGRSLLGRAVFRPSRPPSMDNLGHLGRDGSLIFQGK